MKVAVAECPGKSVAEVRAMLPFAVIIRPIFDKEDNFKGCVAFRTCGDAIDHWSSQPVSKKSGK